MMSKEWYHSQYVYLSHKVQKAQEEGNIDLAVFYIKEAMAYSGLYLCTGGKIDDFKEE